MGNNPVAISELQNSLDSVAWSLAQAEVDKMPPYLADDELTVERFYERNKAKMSKLEAKELLDRMAEAGIYERQERRRKGQGGGHVFVYLVMEKGKA